MNQLLQNYYFIGIHIIIKSHQCIYFFQLLGQGGFLKFIHTDILREKANPSSYGINISQGQTKDFGFGFWLCMCICLFLVAETINHYHEPGVFFQLHS